MKSEKRKKREASVQKIRHRPEFTREEWSALSFVLGWCMRCGSEEDLTKDHIQPLAKGGRNSLANLTLLCKTCNGKKGSKQFPLSTPKYLLPSQQERLMSLADDLRAIVAEAIHHGYSSGS